MSRSGLADPVSGELWRAAMDGVAAAGPGIEPEPELIAAQPEPAAAGLASPEPEAQCGALAELAGRALEAGDQGTAGVSLQALVRLRERLAAAHPVSRRLDALAEAEGRLAGLLQAGPTQETRVRR